LTHYRGFPHPKNRLIAAVIGVKAGVTD